MRGRRDRCVNLAPPPAAQLSQGGGPGRGGSREGQALKGGDLERTPSRIGTGSPGRVKVLSSFSQTFLAQSREGVEV